MGALLRTTFDLVDGSDDAATPADLCRLYFAKLKPLGFGAIFARAHALEPGDTHEHVLYQERPPGFDQVYATRNFAATNFVTRAARRRAAPFRWSGLANTGDADLAESTREMWGVLGTFGLADGIAIPNHTLASVTVLSLATHDGADLSAAQMKAIVLSSHFIHERLRELGRVPFPEIRLTRRERDCVAFAAEGKSDWDMSLIFGIAESTVHSHVENAKRKLRVKTRLQAYARLARAGEL